jgi:hypothetical protein
MSKADVAQLISGVVIVLLTLVLALVGRKDKVAKSEVTYTLADGTTTRTIRAGNVIPSGDVEQLEADLVKEVRRSWLGAIVAGTDHRASTSKTVVFAWTLAVAFGLLSLLLAALL